MSLFLLSTLICFWTISAAAVYTHIPLEFFPTHFSWRSCLAWWWTGMSCSPPSIIRSIDTGVRVCAEELCQQKRIRVTGSRWTQIWTADSPPLLGIIAQLRFLPGTSSVLVLRQDRKNRLVLNIYFQLPLGPHSRPARRGFSPVLALLDHLPSQHTAGTTAGSATDASGHMSI